MLITTFSKKKIYNRNNTALYIPNQYSMFVCNGITLPCLVLGSGYLVHSIGRFACTSRFFGGHRNESILAQSYGVSLCEAIIRKLCHSFGHNLYKCMLRVQESHLDSLGMYLESCIWTPRIYRLVSLGVIHVSDHPERILQDVNIAYNVVQKISNYFTCSSRCHKADTANATKLIRLIIHKYPLNTKTNDNKLLVNICIKAMFNLVECPATQHQRLCAFELVKYGSLNLVVEPWLMWSDSTVADQVVKALDKSIRHPRSTMTEYKYSYELMKCLWKIHHSNDW